MALKFVAHTLEIVTKIMASPGIEPGHYVPWSICRNKILQKEGLVRELNPGPLVPETRIIPLDQQANKD